MSMSCADAATADGEHAAFSPGAIHDPRPGKVWVTHWESISKRWGPLPGSGFVNLPPEPWRQVRHLRAALVVLFMDHQYAVARDLVPAVVVRPGFVCRHHAESHPGSLFVKAGQANLRYIAGGDPARPGFVTHSWG